jgi:SAM-dependent methyltransferase
VKDALGLTALQEQIDRLERRIDGVETRMYESQPAISTRSRVRWRDAAPNPDLTWGKTLTGDAFVGKVLENVTLRDKAVLEIGPGYGRVLAGVLMAEPTFRSYTGVDISRTNVEHLQRRFSDPRITFIHGDVESASVRGPVDVVLSSLTLKHLYPSLEPGLANVASQLSDTGAVCFDLIEGNRRFFEADQVTFIHEYTRQEVTAILERVGLPLVSFDVVIHAPGRERLFVVARTGPDLRPAQAASPRT